MDKSIEATTIYEVLGRLQKDIGALKKTETNPFFKSKYLDINSLLETLRPHLEKHGLVIAQPIVMGSSGQPVLRTILVLTSKGETIDSLVPLPVNEDPQKMGSTITYYRRYALQSMLGLYAEDDDGNHAAGKQTNQEVQGYDLTAIHAAENDPFLN